MLRDLPERIQLFRGRPDRQGPLEQRAQPELPVLPGRRGQTLPYRGLPGRQGPLEQRAQPELPVLPGRRGQTLPLPVLLVLLVLLVPRGQRDRPALPDLPDLPVLTLLFRALPDLQALLVLPETMAPTATPGTAVRQTLRTNQALTAISTLTPPRGMYSRRSPGNGVCRETSKGRRAKVPAT